MRSKLRYYIRRLGERLWIRPLAYCVFAVLAALGASAADGLAVERYLPEVELKTIEKLLSILAASMLGVATFAVGSMVSAYASASGSATPRAFKLILADDVSQNALSTFIGAFIFSIVSLVAVTDGLYGVTGQFVLFAITLGVFGWVVLTFVGWVDQIARLGRLGTTILRVEKAAERAIDRRRHAPHLGGLPVSDEGDPGEPVFSDTIGYVQHIAIPTLQSCAKKIGAVVTVAALPGTFIAPGRALVFVRRDAAGAKHDDAARGIAEAFTIGRERSFDEDPRFGLIALSEIAARALSPAVNDPGTAIGITGTLVRLFALWVEPLREAPEAEYDRVRVPALVLDEMFDDAFTAIARDGAGVIEVIVRLQKAFISLAATGDPGLRAAARRHSRLAMARAERELVLPEDLERARALAGKVG